MSEQGDEFDRRRFLRVAGFAAAAIPLAACSSGGVKPPGGSPRSPSPSNSALTEAGRTGLQVGDELPTVTSEAIEGPEIDMSRFRGHPLLVNFWASTCLPCTREFPLLEGVLERHSDLPILGIDVMDRKADAAKFVNEHDATWPSIWDPDGSIAAKFRVRVLPVTFAVGRSFRLVDRIFGELDRNRLDSMVEAILRS